MSKTDWQAQTANVSWLPLSRGLCGVPSILRGSRFCPPSSCALSTARLSSEECCHSQCCVTHQVTSCITANYARDQERCSRIYACLSSSSNKQELSRSWDGRQFGSVISVMIFQLQFQLQLFWRKLQSMCEIIIRSKLESTSKQYDVSSHNIAIYSVTDDQCNLHHTCRP